MGRIVEVPSHNGVLKFFVSEYGYSTPVEPKTRKHYSFDAREFKITSDYSLEDLCEAEKKFIFLQEELDKKFSDIFVLNVADKAKRIAYIHVKNSDASEYDEQSSFCVFNFQAGLVYNMAVNSLGELIDRESLPHEGHENTGVKVETALQIFESIKINASNFMLQHDVDFDVTKLNIVLNLYKLRSRGVVFGDLNQWLGYIKYGLNLESIVFAFQRKILTHSNKPVPVECVEDYQKIPYEWVEKLIS